MHATALLRDSFLSFLDQQRPEQEYQEFIEKNTALVPRVFELNHGVHLDLVFRKLSLGSDYTSDFFYLSKSSVEWNCVLIEIEKPHSKYFKNASTKLHPDFQAALEQISNWRAWFSNRSNFDGFVDGMLGQIRGSMRINPCSIKYILIHGRRTEFDGNEKRKDIIRSHNRDDFTIMSYESLHSKKELYVAVRKNDHIEVLSRRFITEYLFTALPPSYIKITDELHKSILDNKQSWHTYTINNKLILEDILPQIGVLHDAATS